MASQKAHFEALFITKATLAIARITSCVSKLTKNTL